MISHQFLMPFRCALWTLFAALQTAAASAQVTAEQTSVIFIVTSTADRGPGTLRDAMERANTDGAPSTIQFAVGGDILIDNILPPIADRLHPTIIDGTSAPSRVRIRSSAIHRGSALLMTSPRNTMRSIDFFDVDFDVLNLLETSDGNLLEDVAVINCRRGIGIVLLGADDNRFERVRVEGNAATGVYARDGADRNHFASGFRAVNNGGGGIIMRGCNQNQFFGTSAAPVELDQNSQAGLALIAGSSGNVVGPWVTVTGGVGNSIRISGPLTAYNVLQDVVANGIVGNSYSLGYGAFGNQIVRCRASNQTGAGVVIEAQAQSNQVTGCTIVGRAGAGASLVMINGALDTTVSDCVFRGSGMPGSTLSAYGLTVSRSSRTILLRGDFGNLQGYGVAIVEQSAVCLVVDCTVSNVGGTAPAQGILVQGAPGIPLAGVALLDCRLLSCRDAGINVQYALDPLIEDCTIQSPTNIGLRLGAGAERVIARRNVIDGAGSSGVSLNGAYDSHLLNNTIRSNGIGVYAAQHLGELRFDGNRVIASRQGGLSLGSVTALVTNNLFDANDIGVGAASSALPNTRLIHNTFVYNRIGSAGGGEIWNSIYWFNGLDMTPATLTWANVRSNGLQMGNARIGMQGNISATPFFVNATSLSGDFHLTLANSPLINGASAIAPGMPTADFDGQARIQGAAPDMGMDEVR